MVFLRDVAQVRDGFPPQTNIVRVDGQRAALLTILKTGAASTLDIISSVRETLAQTKDSLPPNLEITPIADQSLFVRASIDGVVKEALIAACLTGLMILLFLGSWRSTLIIAVSIPLSILMSLAILSALGETINIMTLGGFALAVGILVDDATVEIENINRNLAQGKEITAGDPGRRRADRGAGVRLDAFDLHRLRADVLPDRRRAVSLRAAGRGRRLRDALVVLPLAHARADHGALPPARRPRQGSSDEGRPPTNFFGRLQRRFEERFERMREAYRRLLEGVMAHPALFAVVFLAFCAGSAALLFPWLGRDFFPSVDSGQIKLHVRAKTGTRIEETARLCDRIDGVDPVR